MARPEIPDVPVCDILDAAGRKKKRRRKIRGAQAIAKRYAFHVNAINNNRFHESYNAKYFKEIKRLKSLQKAEGYLEPKRASTMQLFREYN